MFDTAAHILKIPMIERRLVWPLRRGDMQIREAFEIVKILKRGYRVEHYVEPRVAVGISCRSMVGAKRRKLPVVQCHHKQTLPRCDSFSSCGVVSSKRVFYGQHILKLEQCRED